MAVFVDTSAILAMAHLDDPCHDATAAAWRTLVAEDEMLVTTNYVVLEASALVQRRLGMDALQALLAVVVPGLEVLWVDADDHEDAVAALLTANRRQLSLVDCVSFIAMRREGLQRALTLDRHFVEQGFTALPGPETTPGAE